MPGWHRSLLGVLDAHLHPELGTTSMSLYERIVHMFAMLRRSLLLIFCAYSGFVLAGWAFQKMTEYARFFKRQLEPTASWASLFISS